MQRRILMYILGAVFFGVALKSSGFDILETNLF